MKHCPRCGRDISDEMHFCPGCGCEIYLEPADTESSRSGQSSAAVLRWLILCAVFLTTIAAIALAVSGKLAHSRSSEPSAADTPPSETADAAIPPASQRPVVTSAPTPEPKDEDLVFVRDVCPGIASELHYATTDNFTGVVIYDFTDPMLRYGTAKKLALAQSALAKQGYSLQIWDAYRPVWAQFRLWEICPDSTYVANPNTGYSSHSRGNTVDVTLIRSDGSAVEMPSHFDDFSSRADRDYSDVSETAGSNAQILERAMTDAGFIGYSAEWWHYTDAVTYPVLESD